MSERRLIEQATGSPGATRLVQITDTHLFANTAELLVGMNSEESLRDVLQLVRTHEPELQAIVCTGDVSQDNSIASYQRLEHALGTFGVPQYWLPGNHDELERMRAAIGADNPCLVRSFAVPGWRVILGNSSVEGEVFGRLSPAELEFLAAELQAATEPNILLCLHHNPVPVAAHWLQRHALKNAEALFALVDACPRVRVVLFGHIHHELARERSGVWYLGTPSTCIQFHPDSHDFALDQRNPGYRWFSLYPDGRFETGVRRVEDKRYAVDFSGVGY